MYSRCSIKIPLARVVKRNKVYYQKYPKDIKRVKEILAYLSKNEVLLPNGGRLTPNRWLQLGIAFGMHGTQIIIIYFPLISIPRVGGIDAVHRKFFPCQLTISADTPHASELVFRASTDLEMFGRLSYKTLQKVQYSQSLDGNPLYAVLHEPIYCQGFVISPLTPFRLMSACGLGLHLIGPRLGPS